MSSNTASTTVRTEAGSSEGRSWNSLGFGGSTKLQPHHLERSAIVYVRQSSAKQVLEHQESAARQYALIDRAGALGWPTEQVEVIDEDQGHSGSTAEDRLGFHRLLAEVALNHVGIVFGIETSRLARSNKDWHQLIEVCAIFRTLLADQDGLYDPTDYNDRLLLGLKGTMSEAELHILRGRMYEAALNKARRGELYVLPPIGYVKLPAEGFALDPDEQVRSVVQLIFDEFDRCGTSRGVIRYLVQNGIKMPVRPHAGPNRGRIEWRDPTRDAVSTILKHPLYAGTYRYGHRQVDPRRKKPGQPGSGRVIADADSYHALIPNHCPAYITLERYERNQRRLAENQARAESKGAPREGQSLLGGLVVCGHCERRMAVHYSGRQQTLRYACRSGRDDCQSPCCRSLSGRGLDELVAEKLLAALEPAALELSLSAAENLQDERARLETNWQQRLERAQYEAERAERQYEAVEPENRLVARELERRWEAALGDLQAIQQEFARFRQTRPSGMSVEEREAILALSQNLPAVWNASSTSPADRQRIVRLLLERVVVHVYDRTEQCDVTLHWSGGFTSQHALIRPVLRYDQMGDYDRLVARITELRKEGLSHAQIARNLNSEGFRPVKRADQFDGDMVSRIVRRLEKQRPTSKVRVPEGLLQDNEWLVVDLAEQLKIPKNTLFAWIKRGWIRVARQLPGYRGRTICWADASELDRLERLRKTKHGWWDPALPDELTTPKSLPNQGRQTSKKPR